MQKTDYNAEHIKTIEELIDHIKQNVGMYAGETETPLHLFEECFTNSLDEAIAGYCNIIAVNVDSKNNTYNIIDNGRGIPIENDVPISISTKFSGAKFKNSKTAYRITSGKHGVGLVVVNALSEWYQIEVYRDNKYALFQFENGKLINNEITDFEDKRPFSTKVSFKPNKEFFDKEVIPIDKIRNRLITASVEIEDCSLVLNDIQNEQRDVIKLDRYKFFEDNCLSSDNNSTTPIDLTVYDKYEKFSVLFSYGIDGPLSPKIYSSLNVLPVEDGGTHVNVFFNILKEILINRAKKLGYKFQPADITARLRAYLSLYIEQPEFGAQSKDKLTNKISYFDNLSKKLKSSLENHFNKNPNVLEEILNQLHEYRRNLDSKKFKNKTGGKKRGSFKFTKLKDCSSSNGELFICEGDSAGNTLIEARNPEIHAIFPLKGKIPSIDNQKTVLNNKETKELIQVLGTGIGKDFDISKLRYDKIIGAVDADPDGGHIFSLLSMILLTLTPEIIRQGKFYLVRTPLRAINEKNTFIPLWTEEEYQNAIANNRYVTRFKGLGELNSNQLKKCAIDEDTRRLIQIQYPQNEKYLYNLFTNVDERRKLLVDDNVELLEDI